MIWKLVVHPQRAWFDQRKGKKIRWAWMTLAPEEDGGIPNGRVIII
jgi:hypothetical protein